MRRDVGAQRIRKRGMVVEAAAVFAERVSRRCAGFAQRVQPRDAGCLRAAPDFGVQRGRIVAELAHVAQHQPAFAAAGRQRVDRGVERPGVGVVAVVDQHRAAGKAMRVEATGDRAGGVEAGCNHRQLDAGAQRQRCRRQCVEVIVAPRHRQRDRRFALRCNQHEARAFGIQHDIARGHVGIRVQREADQAMTVGAFRENTLFEIGHERIVGIDYRDAVFWQCVVNCGLGLGYAQQAAQALQVCG